MLNKILLTPFFLIYLLVGMAVPCQAEETLDEQMNALDARHEESMRGLSGQDWGIPLEVPSTMPSLNSTSRASSVPAAKPATSPRDGDSSFWTGTLWADQGQRPKHEFNFGIETYNYRYGELVNGKKFMSTKGLYNGLVGAYTFRPPDLDTIAQELFDFFRFEMRYALGNVDYTGSGTYSGLKDTVFETRALMGKEYDVTPTFLVTAYGGAGFRYLNNGLEAYQPGGYNRESMYLYLPLGIQVYQRLSDGWGIGGGLEYDHFLNGVQTSHLEDVDPQFDPMKNKQHKGFGFRGSLKVVKELPRMNVSIEPFYRYWKIEDSTIEKITADGQETGWAGQEPENTTHEIGVKLGAQF